ncbi:MAG: ATP-dependent DNA helicase RecG [Bacteroidota bacterium]
MNFLDTPINFLKGVGPHRADLLKSELGIFTFRDLLYHFPFRYVDRSISHSIKDIPSIEGPVQLNGTITHLVESGIGRAKKLTAKFEDGTGKIDLIWFAGIKWVKDSIKVGQEYQLYGRAKLYGTSWNISHPELSINDEQRSKSGFQPVYPSTEKLTSAGLHSKGIEKLIGELLIQLPPNLEDDLPTHLLERNRLVGWNTALHGIHQPQGSIDFQEARHRLKFEELFFLQMELLLRKQISISKSKGHILTSIDQHFNDFFRNYLPFELTGAQKKVIKEIRKDVVSGSQMNRLIQGDVGSGKTLVALLTMLMATDNGLQAALMAPTEILANQHYVSIKEFLKDLPIEIALLTGSVKTKDRRVIHEGLQNGSIHLLIGTHALLEDTVQFRNIGMVVIDEQHRFGVAQRARLWKKNVIPPHILIMTATPIPRTLAMTFYGDLDVSVIDELPPGRKPISTSHYFESSRLKLFGFLKEEIEKGRQVYIVYPLIQESEKLDFNNLMDGFEAISRSFPLPNYKVSIVHGKLKPADKEFEMNRFVKGETQIMVATTVIEVGVNVPNASVMVIESAERFGLSQLHQLRGRVGRGAEKSYCILMTGNKLSKETKKRIDTMVRTNDGFEIAEVDLQIRGPGDLLGTQQSGLLNLKIADLARDQQIVVMARDEAKFLLSEDPGLQNSENGSIRRIMKDVLDTKPNWGKIG